MHAYLNHFEEVTPSQKFQAVNAVAALILEGKTPNQACAITGLSRSNYERWSKALAQAEGNAWEAFAERRPTGRPTVAEFTPEETAIARWHRLTKESLPVAIYFFLDDKNELIRPEIKEAIRTIENRALENGTRAHYPPSIRRAFHVTAEDRAAFRGGKAPQNTELVTRRSLDWIDAEGQVHTFLPGQLWEMDDYSANQPFAYPDLESGEIRTGRQVLAALDVASAGWLSFDAIGRPKDAYRGEDILRFIERSFRAHGMPLFLRLERGSWDSSYIHGIDVPDLITGWGALDALVNIQHVWKSKGKGTIEGSFDPLQTWLSHASLDIGRHRGEFAAQTKAMRQAANSTTLDDVRRLGLWEQAEAIAAHEEAAKIMNSRPRRRDIIAPGKYISADDLRAQQGWHTTELPASEAWRFFSCKRKATIAGGIVTINPGGGYPETSFVCNGVDGRHFDNGYSVLVAFDPAQPELGAYIANADRSHRNINAIPIGEKLMTAPLHDRAPQINLSGKQHHSISLRKAASAAATTEFRAIKSGSGNSNLRVTAAGDGQGRRIEISNQPRHIETPRETPAGTPAVASAKEGQPSANLRETPTEARRSLGEGGSPRATTPVSRPSDLPSFRPSDPQDRLAQLRAAEAAALDSL